MTDMMALVVQYLPQIGKTIMTLMGVLVVGAIFLYVLHKNREALKANVCADLYHISAEGNILSKERIWGHEDKENKIKEVYFKKLEETLSLENAVPILEKATGKIRKVYQVFKYPDGKIVISNPSILPFEYENNTFIFKVDNQLLDYKRWYASEVLRAAEQRYREESLVASKKNMIMMTGAFIACVAIVGIGVYFSVKLGMLSITMGYDNVATQADLLRTVMQQNMTILN